jgi:hypothetical protein
LQNPTITSAKQNFPYESIIFDDTTRGLVAKRGKLMIKNQELQTKSAELCRPSAESKASARR